MSDELQQVKDEIATLATRMDNVEGYFDNFSKTLDNHMKDYAERQGTIAGQVDILRAKFSIGFWVIFGLLTTVIGGFIAGLVVLLQYLFRQM